jgi:hypothetical protein
MKRRTETAGGGAEDLRRNHFFSEEEIVIMDVSELKNSRWFAALVEEVRREAARLAVDRQDQRPALQQEMERLGQQMQGLMQSLAKSDLNVTLRSAVEADCEKALQRQQEIEHSLETLENQRRQVQQVIEPQQVADRLGRLAEVLASDNPARGNLELSSHIDRIACFADGKVVVRTCKLGALAGAAELLAEPGAKVPTPADPPPDGVRKATPRRRARLRVTSSTNEAIDLAAAVSAAADVNRFKGLGPGWFWEDVFQVPAKTCWSDDHAEEVYRLRQETTISLEKLAVHFGVTKPTIQRALRVAQARRGGPLSPEASTGQE